MKECLSVAWRPRQCPRPPAAGWAPAALRLPCLRGPGCQRTATSQGRLSLRVPQPCPAETCPLRDKEPRAGGHAPTQRTRALPGVSKIQEFCCLEAGNAAALIQPFHTVYGFKDRSWIKPCPSPDKGTERGTAGPGLPGPRQMEDA